MWQQLTNEEEILIGAEIDALDQSNSYAGDSWVMARTELSFYPGARLIRVTSRQIALGDKYFIYRDEKIVPLRGLDEIQPLCDRYYKVMLTPENAADHFRFAYFFTTEGRRCWLVESPADLKIDPATDDPSEVRAIAFIRPVETEREGMSVKVHACTVDENSGQLYRDAYLLTPEKALERLKREESGIILEDRIFVDRELKVGRSDIISPNGRVGFSRGFSRR
jgi:hypothetical protein